MADGIVNTLTGEAVVGGVEILFTIEAWVMVEARLGKSALELLDQLQSGKAGFTDTIALVECAHEAWRRREATGAPSLRPQDAMNAIGRAGGLMSSLAIIGESIIQSGTLIPRTEAEVPAASPLA